MKYLHAAAFIPVKSTWIKNIHKRYFQSCPGITVKLVNKYLWNSVSTARGHIDQIRENMQSAKTQEKEDTDDAKISDSVFFLIWIVWNRKVGHTKLDIHRPNLTLPSHIQKRGQNIFVYYVFMTQLSYLQNH